MTRRPHLQSLMTVMRRPVAWIGVLLFLGMLTPSLAFTAGREERHQIPEILLLVNAPLFLGFLGWPMLAWFSGTAACTVPGFRPVHERVGWAAFGFGLALLVLALAFSGMHPLNAVAFPLAVAACLLAGNTAVPGRDAVTRAESWAVAVLMIPLFTLILVRWPPEFHAALMAGRLPLLSLAVAAAGVAVLLRTAYRLRRMARARVEENLGAVMSMADRTEAAKRSKELSSSAVPAGAWPVTPVATPAGLVGIPLLLAAVAAGFLAPTLLPPDHPWLPMIELFRWHLLAGVPLVAMVLCLGHFQRLRQALPVAIHRPTPRAVVAIGLTRRVLLLGGAVGAAGLLVALLAGAFSGLRGPQLPAAGLLGFASGAAVWFTFVRTSWMSPQTQIGLLFGLAFPGFILVPTLSRFFPSVNASLLPPAALLALLLAVALALETCRWLRDLEWGTLP